MKAVLFAALEKHIQAWANENCDQDNNWPDVYYDGEYGAENMTKAAAAVFDAAVDIQLFIKREGLA